MKSTPSTCTTCGQKYQMYFDITECDQCIYKRLDAEIARNGHTRPNFTGTITV